MTIDMINAMNQHRRAPGKKTWAAVLETAKSDPTFVVIGNDLYEIRRAPHKSFAFRNHGNLVQPAHRYNRAQRGFNKTATLLKLPAPVAPDLL